MSQQSQQVDVNTIASERAITEAKDFATEFMVNELDIIRRALKEKELHDSDSSMGSKYDESIVGNFTIHLTSNGLSLDMYVFIPGEEKPEVVFFTFTRAEGKSKLLFSSEDYPKPNVVPVDMVPAFVSLENVLNEFGL